MLKSKLAKVLIVLLVCLSISHFPEIAVAQVAERMIPTSEVVETLSRVDLEANIQSYLDREDLKKELTKIGLSTAEISKRMASLSTEELKQLSKQLEQARYGGEVVEILIVVLLVILIIYLVKRI